MVRFEFINTNPIPLTCKHLDPEDFCSSALNSSSVAFIKARKYNEEIKIKSVTNKAKGTLAPERR